MYRSRARSHRAVKGEWLVSARDAVEHPSFPHYPGCAARRTGFSAMRRIAWLMSTGLKPVAEERDADGVTAVLADIRRR